MEMNKIENFQPNQLSFGKSPKGDFYFHMKSEVDGVDDIICYREVALDLLKNIATLSDSITVPDYKSLEMGKRESILLQGYPLELSLNDGYIKESKGRNVFTFKSYSVTSEPVMHLSNSNDTVSLEEYNKLKEANAALESKNAELVKLNEELLSQIEEQSKKISDLELFSNDIEAENDIVDEINDALDGADSLDDVGNSENDESFSLEDSGFLGDLDDNMNSSEMSDEKEIEFGNDVDFGEGSPEDFAMSLMGSDMDSLNVEELSIEEDLDSTEKGDPFDDTPKAEVNTDMKVSAPIGFKKPAIGGISAPKIGGLAKVSKPVTQQESKSESDIKEASTNIKENSPVEVDSGVKESPKVMTPKISTPKISGFKAPKINISAPKIGGM